jgi:hypothetical protein
MKTILVLTTSILLTAAPVLAQRGPGAPKPTTSHGASAPKTTTSHGASAPKPTTSHAAQAPKTTHGSTPKAGKTTSGSGHAASKTTTSGSSVKTTTKTTKTTTTTTTVGPTTTLSPVQLKLQKNTNLASKLQSRLPAGTNLTLAAADFRNLGQFVAAVNVSNNLGIPFTELKTRMVDQGMSLGQAIQDARPKTTDTTLVVRRAETDADVLIRTTEQQQTTTTTVTKTKKPKKGTSGGQ